MMQVPVEEHHLQSKLAWRFLRVPWYPQKLGTECALILKKRINFSAKLLKRFTNDTNCLCS